MRRNHVQDITFDFVIECRDRCQVGGINGIDFHVVAIFNNAFVLAIPLRFKQACFGDHVLVCIQDDDLGLWLFRLEIMRHLAGTLVGPGRTPVWRFRNRHHEHAAVAHVFELFAQCDGLRAGFPAMHHALLRRCIEALDLVKHKIDTGRDDQAVKTQVLNFFQFDGFLVDVDFGHFVVDHLHAVIT